MRKQKYIVQDDDRETLIINHCGIKPTGTRYGVDATDDLGNEFEIKSGTTEKYISTSRDFGIDKLNAYKSVYWIIGSGDYHSSEFILYELYIATPQNLSFFFRGIEEKLREQEKVVDTVLSVVGSVINVYDYIVLEHILKRGSMLNDPRIQMREVRTNCTELNCQDSVIASQQVKEFVQNNPIMPYIQNENRSKFFDWSVTEW